MEFNQKVSIIIPTYNRERIIEETLIHIDLKCLYPKDLFEVIVVNDGEKPIKYLKNVVSNLNLSIVNNPGQGAASARNFGFKSSKHDFILFIDDDILIEPLHIQNHLIAHQKNSNSLVTANRIEAVIPGQIIKNSSFARYKVKHDYIWHEGGSITKKINSQYWLMNDMATFSCSLSRVDFESIGMFDEKFPYAGREDSDFFYRARKMGYNLIYDTKNNCDHNEPFNFKLDKWLWRHYTGTQSYVLFCEKHLECKQEGFYQINMPIKASDSIHYKFEKALRICLSSEIIKIYLLKLANSIDSWSRLDKFSFKIFNLLFIIHTYSGFQKGLQRLK